MQPPTVMLWPRFSAPPEAHMFNLAYATVTARVQGIICDMDHKVTTP